MKNGFLTGVILIALTFMGCIKEYDGSGSGSGSVDQSDEFGSNCDGINGKWMLLNSCTNSNNESTWFNFTASETSCVKGVGKSFAADCNSACIGLGVRFYYTWTSTSSTINITWTGVDDYCGISSNTPSPEVLNYSLSGDILNINGQDYQRQ